MAVALPEQSPESAVADNCGAVFERAQPYRLDQLVQQAEVEQLPTLRHQDVGDRPVVVAVSEGDLEDLLGQVDRAPRQSRVHGAPVAHVLESQHPLAGDEGDGDVAGQQGVEEVFGQLADGAVEELDRVVAGVEAWQLAIREHDPIAQAILAGEDDRLRRHRDGAVDLVVCKVTFLHGGPALAGELSATGPRGRCRHRLSPHATYDNVAPPAAQHRRRRASWRG